MATMQRTSALPKREAKLRSHNAKPKRGSRHAVKIRKPKRHYTRTKAGKRKSLMRSRHSEANMCGHARPCEPQCEAKCGSKMQAQHVGPKWEANNGHKAKPKCKAKMWTGRDEDGMGTGQDGTGGAWYARARSSIYIYICQNIRLQI